MTWKCSTACTDFRALPFENQITYNAVKTVLKQTQQGTDVIRLDARSKGLLHIVINFLRYHRGNPTRDCIFLELKLGPNNEMGYVLVDSVRPIVVENLEVFWKMESSTLVSHPLRRGLALEPHLDFGMARPLASYFAIAAAR
jgi:hypothetical protein